MTDITRHNYEEFFLDYLEGTLSSVQRVALEDFLTKNPDLKIELEDMECPVLSKANVQIDSESLKEIPYRESFDDFCVARMEGDLSIENEIAFDSFLEKNEAFKKENEIYKKTILIADSSLVFTDKDNLKRSSRKVVFWWYFSRVGVAASIVLLFSLWSIFYQFEDDYTHKENLTAKVETTVSESNEIAESNTSIEVEELVKPEQKGLQSEEKASPKASEPATIKMIANKVKIQDTEEVVVRVRPLKLSSEIKLIALVNVANPAIEIDVPKEKKININPQNNGLAQLGMSWKSSVSERRAQKSVLFAIAKYGVDKLGEIAGKNVQLEKKYDSTTEKTRLDFNTAGIGFSKTIK